MYGYFKRQISEISDENLDIAKKGKPPEGNWTSSNSSIKQRIKSQRVFTNGPGDLGSIPGRVIPKTLKMVLDTSLLNTQQYKERIKSKVEQSRERSGAFSYNLV